MDRESMAAMKKTTYDVGVDQNGYKPISYWQLCDIIRKQMSKK
jgi:calcineurin-like phosphoesterase family protein